MQRIPSGVVDQYVYFVAVDSTDYVTPETGLSSFTVYRSRNGGTATVYTTPTISEMSSSNMPGLYRLLVDEDTTIDSGDDSQVMALHITATGMAPARVLVELYRPPVTPGQQITVSSGAVSNVTTTATATAVTTVNGLAANVITAAATATDFGTEVATAVWANGTRILTAGTNIALAKGTGVTGFNDLDAAGVRSAVGLASANLDTQITGINTNVDDVDSDLAGLITDIGANGAGLTALPWNAAWDAEVQSECTDALNAYDPPTNAEMVARTLASADYATAAALATTDGVVDAIKITTDKLDTALELDGAVYRYTTNALEQAPSGGGGGPTASQIADEVQTRTIAAVTVVNGLAANTVNASALAADAVSEIQSGLATASAVADLPTNAELTTALSGFSTQASLDAVAGKVSDVWTIHGLDIGNPMTVTPTSREAGVIEQTISGDGTTTSTVTRTA